MATRLSYGEIDWPNEGVRRMTVRRYLLQAIEDHVQEQLVRVYDEMLPHYRARRNDELLALEVKVEEWKKKYPSWLIEALFRLLHRYGRSPLERPDRLSFAESEGSLKAKHLVIVRIVDNELKRFGVDLPLPEPPEGLGSYCPLLETRVDYLSDIREQAAEALKEHSLLRYAAASEKSDLADSVRDSDTIVNYCQKVEEVYTAEGFKRRSPLRGGEGASSVIWNGQPVCGLEEKLTPLLRERYN